MRFEQAGFAARRRGAGGEVTVSLDITPTEVLKERIAERDHLGAVASLRPILAPASVAVVGASSSPGSLGGAVLANIVDGLHDEGEESSSPLRNRRTPA
jgi:hypothetical protein